MEKQSSIAFHTLGCKLNFSETSTLKRQFNDAGYVKKDFNEQADVYVINTCSVTENADKECKQLIRRVKKINPSATVVITGCYAQLKPTEISNIEGVDLVIGASEKFNIVEHLSTYKKDGQAKICSCDIEEIQGFQAAYSLTDRTRTFLKVQDGCDYNCSFCTIPLARGHSRSDSIQGVLGNVRELANAGVKEVVLTGVNLGDFGKGYYGNKRQVETFFDLIQALDEFDGIERYRISSIEPNLLSRQIIEFVTKSKHFMPHFHIPLQSGHDMLLAKMRRRYLSDLYAERITMIKEQMPHCCIGADVIVGFPGESAQAFEESYQFIHNLDLSYLHVFTYSERQNTKALEYDEIVPIAQRRERNARLRNLSEKKMNHFREQFIGQVRPTLFEHADKIGRMEGYTDNYLKMSLPYDASKVNAISPTLIES